MDAYIDIKDVRLTGYASQGLIALVALASVWGTVNDWWGESLWTSVGAVLILPAAVAFIVWFRNATHNAEAIALRGVRFMPDVWKASDPAQREVPFEQRKASPLIKPWQIAFLVMLAFDFLEALMRDGVAYLVFSTLSSISAVVAAGLAVFVIARISLMQQRFAVPGPRGRH